MTILEPCKEIPVSGKYDVVVCGGGIAGVSAALASSRTGAKTLLIEREFGLGGLATLGQVVIYLPICDGKGTQVCYGIAEELLRLSVIHGYEGRYPDAWLEDSNRDCRKNQRFEVQYNGSLYAILLEQQLISAGADILYGTTVCSVDMDGESINAVIIENKSGRQAVIGKSFVDATGDADIFKMVGAKTAVNSKGNPLAAWYFYVSDGEFKLKTHGACDSGRINREAVSISAKRYSGLDGTDLSAMVQDSHASTLSDFLLGGNDTRRHALASIASIPMTRMTRHICGITEARISDDHRSIDDSIGMVPDWRIAGPIYEVPYSSLYGPTCRNLIAAGRITSVDFEMWNVMRVIPACAVTGQAAGTAAAISSDYAKTDIRQLQSILKESGVRLHFDDL